jgi:hypothetical protein
VIALIYFNQPGLILFTLSRSSNPQPLSLSTTVRDPHLETTLIIALDVTKTSSTIILLQRPNDPSSLTRPRHDQARQQRPNNTTSTRLSTHHPQHDPLQPRPSSSTTTTTTTTGPTLLPPFISHTSPTDDSTTVPGRFYCALCFGLRRAISFACNRHH